jgi:beta-lactam-binding protein with PASTA domain
MYKKILLLVVALAVFAGWTAPPSEAVMYYYNIPDVRWMPKEQAASILKAKDCEIILKFVDIEAQDYSQVGKIMKQVSEPGMHIFAEKQKSITITLSVAANGAFVPMVINMAEAAAVDAVKKAGYIPKVEYYSEQMQALQGRVQTSDPLPYRNLAKGGTVTLKVATPAYAMPNLVGNRVEGAKQVIDQLNSVKKLSLKSSFTKGKTTTVPQDDQKIYEQSPAPGTILRVGSEVSFTAYVYTPPPPLPPRPTPMLLMLDMTGKPEKDAVSVLISTGVQVKINYASAPQQSKGRVIAQSVKPGVRTAGPIALTVGR